MRLLRTMVSGPASSGEMFPFSISALRLVTEDAVHDDSAERRPLRFLKAADRKFGRGDDQGVADSILAYINALDEEAGVSISLNDAHAVSRVASEVP